MPPKFLEGISGKLAEQWIATLLSPAFIFWAGGVAAFCEHYGMQTLINWFEQYPEPLQVSILATALATIFVSSFIAQRFDTAILRGLEGYWYPVLRCLLIPLNHYQKARRRKLIQKLNELNSRLNQANERERANFVRYDHALRQFPTKEYDLLPTRLGNILRAAERRPYDRYGLDAVVCWPRLWLLLPDSVKKDLQAARGELNNAARLVLWSLLFLIWSIWVWWSIPLALLSALFSYSWSLDAAEAYAGLIEATFDLHRQLLYQALRWHMPDNADDERRVGKQLTVYLWRGVIQS